LWPRKRVTSIDEFKGEDEHTLEQVGGRQECNNFGLSAAPADPVSVEPGQAGSALADEDHPPQPPSPQDWFLVLERLKP